MAKTIHSMIRVLDEARSIAFYGKAFGLSIADRLDFPDFTLVYLSNTEQEFEVEGTDSPPNALFGLYTSAANAAYIPTSLLKPTDFNSNLRTLLQRRARDLYGDCCRLLPNPFTVRRAAAREWETHRFDWSEPVGDLTNVAAFLEYRRRTLSELLTKRE